MKKKGIPFLLFILSSVFSGAVVFFASSPALASGPSLHTTPLSLLFEQNFTTKLHVDIPPSPFTFYPNGTIKLANSQTLFLKFNVIPIPFQAPTSFQANNTYAVYSEKGPGPNCFLNWAFKEGQQSKNQGNAALVQMFGTAAQPCAVGATISIKLNAFGSSLQAFNSTGGIAGTLCDVHVASIEWDFCLQVSTLKSITLTYSAGTIQLKTTAQAWSWTDPIAIDGTGYCFVNGCTTSATTGIAGDMLMVIEHDNNPGCNTPSGSITWISRAVSQGGDGDCVHSYYSTNGGAGFSVGTYSATCNWITGNAAFCVIFGISGSALAFDSNAALPCESNAGGVSSNPHCTISTSNANDLLIGAASEGNAETFVAGSGFTDFPSAAACSGAPPRARSCDEYEVVSSTQTSLSVTFTMGVQNSFWDMIADAVKAGVSTVTEDVTITPSNGFASPDSATVTGCHPSVSTVAMDGTQHSFTSDPSCQITFTAPAAANNLEYLVSNGTTKIALYTTPSSGTDTESFTVFALFQNTYQATPTGGSGLWNSAYTLTVPGTAHGSPATSSIVTSRGGGMASVVAYFDYNTNASLPTSFPDAQSGTWFSVSQHYFFPKTGGGTENVQYAFETAATTTARVNCQAGYCYGGGNSTTTGSNPSPGGNIQSYAIILAFLILLIVLAVISRDNHLEVHAKA